MRALCPIAVSTQNLEVVVGSMSAFVPGGNMVAMTFLIFNVFAAPNALPTLFPIFPPLIPFRESADVQTPLTSAQHKLVYLSLVGDILVDFRLSEISDVRPLGFLKYFLLYRCAYRLGYRYKFRAIICINIWPFS